MLRRARIALAGVIVACASMGAWVVACTHADYRVAPPAPWDLDVQPTVIYLDPQISVGSQIVTVKVTRQTGFVDPIDISWSSTSGNPLILPINSTLGADASTLGPTPIGANPSAAPGTWTVTVHSTSGSSSPGVDRTVTVKIGRLLCDAKAAGTTSCAIPENVTRVTVAAWGAGGGSGGSPSGNCSSGVGGSGGFVQADFTVVPGESLAMTVGAGGAGAPPAGFGFGGGGGGYSTVARTDGTLMVVAGAGGGGGGAGNTQSSPGYRGGAGASGVGSGENGDCSIFTTFGCAPGGGLLAGGASVDDAFGHFSTPGGYLDGGSSTGGGAGGAPGGGHGGGTFNQNINACPCDWFGIGGGGGGWFGGASSTLGRNAPYSTSCASFVIGSGGGGGGSTMAIEQIDASATGSVSMATQTYCKCAAPGGGGPATNAGGNPGAPGRVLVYVSQ